MDTPAAEPLPQYPAPPRIREDVHRRFLSVVARATEKERLPTTVFASDDEGEVKATLTEAQVLEIRRLHAEEDLGYRPLARRFGVNPTTVRAILTGRTWTHVKEAEPHVA